MQSRLTVDLLTEGLHQLKHPGSSDWLTRRGKALYYAIERGYMKAIAILHWVGVDVNCKIPPQPNALTLAVLKGSVKITQFLINAGALIHAKNGDGLTALDHAIARSHQECIDLLVGHRATPDLFQDIFHGDVDIYTTAANGYNDTLDRLLAGGMDPDYRPSPYVRTALSVAAEHGHEGTVVLLLKAGANPNMTVDLGRKDGEKCFSPLIYAVCEDHAGIVALLVDAGADIRAKDRYGRNALAWAKEKDSQRSAAFLRNIMEPAINATRRPGAARILGTP